MTKRKAEHEPRKKTGHPYTRAGQWALIYGVPLRSIIKIGVEQFEEMSEESRQVFIAWTRKGKPYGSVRKDFKRGGIKALYPWRFSMEAAIARTGKTTADWMELMACLPQWWEDRPARPERAPRMPVRHFEFKLDEKLPDEQSWRVEKLLQLAENLRVA